jgi:asparagine synthase (glutamine-hydrolysing)
MGAIFGELGAAPSLAACERALGALAHRGARLGATWAGDGLVMGSRMPAPASDADAGLVAVIDGSIFNGALLRDELARRGLPVRSPGDAELVLRAFECWGKGCLERFNGMFAIAVWDGRVRTLLLARDRIGERPLYYFTDGERLVFASEIKAILVDERIERRVDPRALASFLAFAHSGAAVTMFEGIRKLPPGHLLVADGGGAVAVHPWWEVGADTLGADEAAPDELAAEVRRLLDDAVALRMPAGRPIGAFLSGGLDSSAVVALMQRHASRQVHTFTLGYEEGGVFDELAQARRSAAALGTEHHELRVGHAEVLRHLRTLVYHYDEPLGIAAGFNFYVLCSLVREHTGVVLTGDGGDELFGGYRRHVAEQLAAPYQLLPALATQRLAPALIARLPRLGRARQIATVLPIADPALRTAGWLTVLDTELRAELLSGGSDHHPEAVYASLYEGFDGHGGGLNRQLYAELRAWLPDTLLEKTDKPTMARGVDARMPLFDHRIVELAFRIPDRHKVRGRATKRVFREAVKDLVPDHARRQAKRGFTIPVDPWFRGPLLPFLREVLFDERTVGRGYFDSRVVERLVDEHVSGRRIWDRALWMLLNFELWHRVYIDREIA